MVKSEEQNVLIVGAKELYLLDEPQVLSLLVNIEKADYQVIQGVKFAHLHQSTFEPHFFFKHSKLIGRHHWVP